MKFNWIDKKYWKYYFIRISIFIILLIGIKIYKQTHPKEPQVISALDIKEGTFSLFTEELSECGSILIKKINDNDIIINMKGDEINGINVLNKSYKLKSVFYDNYYMRPKTTNYETYYLCDTGETYVILFKIRGKNKYFVSGLKNKKKLFMLCEVSYSEYDFMVNHSDSMELQNRCNSSVDTNRYTCFFEQENSQEHKKTKSLLRRD